MGVSFIKVILGPLFSTVFALSAPSAQTPDGVHESLKFRSRFQDRTGKLLRGTKQTSVSPDEGPFYTKNRQQKNALVARPVPPSTHSFDKLIVVEGNQLAEADAEVDQLLRAKNDA